MTSTAVAQAEAVAQEATRAAAEAETLGMLASVAHELRTPLSALAASAEMLEVADDPEDRRRFAAIIQRQSRRLNGIVEGLLWAYRINSGDAAAVDEVVDVRRLLRQVADDHRPLFPQHVFSVEVVGEPRVLTRAGALAIVVGNLLSNAAKYSPPGSTVRVVARERGRRVEVRVRDQGPGVPPALRERVFEAGERCGQRGPGFGLGLFIARRICAAIGAEIRAEEPGDGKGACFVVTLQRGGAL
jgi:signal transduction histidine kinase